MYAPNLLSVVLNVSSSLEILKLSGRDSSTVQDNVSGYLPAKNDSFEPLSGNGDEYQTHTKLMTSDKSRGAVLYKDNKAALFKVCHLCDEVPCAFSHKQ